MKNVTLFLFLFAIAALNGQISYPSQYKAFLSQDDTQVISHDHPQHQDDRFVDTELVGVGSASDIWTILNPDQTQVDYQPELGLLTFNHIMLLRNPLIYQHSE